jgi:hypothetical protein
MILLAVLVVAGVAAVSLSSQERMNAGTKGKLDFALACANAAQAKIWSELTDHGLGYLGSTLQITPVTLPDGTVLAAGHYGASAGTVTVDKMVYQAECKSANPLAERDFTNTIVARTVGGNCYAIQARCIDPAGRETEVEFGLRFAF